MHYRPTAGRLVIEFFYGECEDIERDGGKLTIHISQLGRRLHLRPVRLIECLEYLQRFGIIKELVVGRKTASFGLREPEWKRKRIFEGVSSSPLSLR